MDWETIKTGLTAAVLVGAAVLLLRAMRTKRPKPPKERDPSP